MPHVITLNSGREMDPTFDLVSISGDLKNIGCGYEEMLHSEIWSEYPWAVDRPYATGLSVEDRLALAQIMVARWQALIEKLSSSAEPMTKRTVPPELYAEIVAPYAAAIAMIRESVGDMFGPAASIESEEAVLLRGPEPHHDAEAIIASLQRLRLAVDRE